MRVSRESLGPAHPLYIHGQGEYTQIAVYRGSACLIAVFTGPNAKRNAAAYTHGEATEIDMDQPF